MSVPLLFACQGCIQYGDLAHEVAQVLAARGFAQPEWLGAASERTEGRLATEARAPRAIYAIEGCGKRCAGAWLRSRGVKPQRQFILAAPGESVERIAERIMEGWPSRVG